MLTPMPSDRVMLIRHAMPDTGRNARTSGGRTVPGRDTELAPSAWRLGADGRAAAQALAITLPPNAYLVASDEPKASETLSIAAGGAAVAIDAGFGEVRRPDAWTDAYRALAAAYVGGATHAGWEPHQAVVRRFDAAVRRHQAIATARRAVLVIGTHGMAMTLWLASRFALEPDPVVFWAALAFPEVVVVDADGPAVVRRR